MTDWAIGSSKALGASTRHGWDYEDEIFTVFVRFDSNGDDTIDAGELAKVLKKLDAVVWTDKAIDTLFRRSDTNKDGRLDIGEFLNFVFNDSGGRAIVETVFQSLPGELTAELFDATRRRIAAGVTLSKEELASLQNWQTPPHICIQVMSAVCWLIFYTGDSDPSEAWQLALKLCFASPGGFLRGLLEPPFIITEEALSRAEEAVDDPGFTREAAGGPDGMPGGPQLVDWARAMVDIHRALRKVRASQLADTLILAMPPGKQDVTSDAVGTRNACVRKSGGGRDALETSLTAPWAAAVAKLRRIDLVELKSFKSPPRIAKDVLAAVCWILTGNGHSDHHYSWQLSRRMMSNINRFMKQLLEPPTVSPEVYRNVQQIMLLHGAEFSYSGIRSVSLCAAALAEWVSVVMQVQLKLVELGDEVDHWRDTLLVPRPVTAPATTFQQTSLGGNAPEAELDALSTALLR